MIFGNEYNEGRNLPYKTFCFDIDDVTGDFVHIVLDWLLKVKKLPTNLSQPELAHVETYDFQTVFGRPLASSEVKEAALESGAYEIMVPDSHIKEFIDSIKEEYRIVFLTSRYAGTEEITKKWFLEHGIFFDLIVYQPYKSWLLPFFHADYLVDDSLENIIKAAKNTETLPVLRERPWNGYVERERLVQEGKFTYEQIDEAMKRVLVIKSIKDLIGRV